MESEAGEDPGVLSRKLQYAWPVGFVGAIDDGEAQAEGRELERDFFPMRREPLVVEVVVRVIEGDRHGKDD